MATQDAGAGRATYLVVVAAVAIWGILSALDIRHVTYTGYTTTPQNVVNDVEAGSPAEAAGMQVGDRITSLGGIPVEDVAALGREPRPREGVAREIGIERDGQAMTLSLTFAGQPGLQRMLSWCALLVGFLFLVLPLLAAVEVRSRQARILAWFGVCFALAFFGGPYIPSAGLRSLVGAVQLTAIVTGFALLLRFVLSFPRDAMADAKPATRALLWGPAGIIALMFVYLMLAQPPATSGLNMVVNALVGLFVIGYFGAALLSLVRRYGAASPGERAASGLSLMFWGAVVGLVPVLVASVVGLVAPMVVLPGQTFYFLTFAAVPVAFTLAVRKGSGTTVTEEAAPVAAH